MNMNDDYYIGDKIVGAGKPATMYLKNHEIDHLQKHHPVLLDQIAGYGLEQSPNRLGYDVLDDIPGNMFDAIIDALQDAPDTRR